MLETVTTVLAAGVPMTGLADVNVEAAVVDGRAHAPGACRTDPAAGRSVPLLQLAPFHAYGPQLCTACLPIATVLGPGGRAFVYAAAEALHALRVAEDAVGPFDPLTVPGGRRVLRALGAMALAPLGADALTGVLGDAERFFAPRATALAATRAALREQLSTGVDDAALCRRLAAYAASGRDRTGQLAAPDDDGQLAARVVALLPDQVERVDLDEVWRQLLRDAPVDWSTEQVAAYLAAACGLADGDDRVRSAAELVLSSWDWLLARQLTRRTPHVLALATVHVHPILQYEAPLVAEVLAGRDAVVRRAVDRDRVAAVVVVPGTVAAGLTAAHPSTATDCGPLHVGDDAAWPLMRRLWTPGGRGPLADADAALTAARGVAAAPAGELGMPRVA